MGRPWAVVEERKSIAKRLGAVNGATGVDDIKTMLCIGWRRQVAFSEAIAISNAAAAGV